MKDANKVRIVKLLNILRQNADEMNPISTTEIIKKLEREGIKTTRQSVYNDIKALNKSGYNVVCSRHTVNKYYIEDNGFDLPEIQILLDAVQAANFITPKKTGELVNKIAALGGSQKDEVVKNNIVCFNTKKHTNEAIYYNINELIHAIVLQKKAMFNYFDYNSKKQKEYRKNKKTYKENPCSLVFSDDNYYLVAYNDNHDTILHYRIDRMDNVQVSGEDAVLPDDFDIQKHKSELFGMFAGETVPVQFEADNCMIDIILDKFGEDVKFMPAQEGKIIFKAEVQISPNFISWVCNFGNKLKVIEPVAVVQQIKNYLSELARQYQ